MALVLAVVTYAGHDIVLRGWQCNYKLIVAIVVWRFDVTDLMFKGFIWFCFMFYVFLVDLKTLIAIVHVPFILRNGEENLPKI